MRAPASPFLARPLLAAILSIAGPAGAATGGGAAPNARYVVFELSPAGIRPVFAKDVRLARAPAGRSRAAVRAALSVPGRENDVVDVTVERADGIAVFSDSVEVSRWVRAELPRDPASRTLEPARVEPETRAFAVRVPLVERAKLVIRAPGFGRTRAFDLDALAKEPGVAAAFPVAAGDVRTVSAAGPSDNRVDFLIMGDGYTAAQSAKFDADAATVAGQMLGIAPYSTYANAVRVVSLFTASAQAGADHPAYAASCAVAAPPTCCSDPIMQNDPQRGTLVDTAFDGSYCYYNIHRLTYVNTSKVLVAAAADPDWDAILVLVNDTTYGGAGGSIAVVSSHRLAVDIERHEFGHSFTGLADEYADPYPGFPACSDVAAVPAAPCEPNVTNETARDLVKWAPFFATGTPVPTPDTAPYANAVGLFEGARFHSTGMFRPKHTCLMRALGTSFCEVCAQEFVLRLYRGGWGEPRGGIDMIEPGSESPAPGAVAAAAGSPMTFTATLLQPSGGPALAVSWLLDGVVQAGATGPSFSFQPSAGVHQVVLRVHDPTPLVHPSLAGDALDRSRVWNVTAAAPLSMVALLPSSARAAGAGGAFFTTDLLVANAGAQPATAVLKFLGHDADGSGGAERTVALGAGETKALSDVLASVFGETANFGAILVSSASSDVRVLSQTSTPGFGGTFGQSVPAATPAELIPAGASRSILAVREDAGFRTNLVLANATSSALDVDVTLVAPSGAVLGTKRYALPPLGMTQVSRVARALGVSADVSGARLVLSTPTAGGSFAAYASAIDNVTNDPRTLLPR